MLNGRNREIIDFAGRVSDVSKRMGYSAGLLLLFLLSLTSLPVEAQSNIQPARPAFNLRRIYVSPEGAGTFDGSSWANAAKGSDLQMILRSTDTWNAINSTLQIWIAAGTYVPTEPLLPGDEQSASFVLKGNQVVVYGGFRGQVFDDLGALVYEGENSLEEREYGNVYSGDRQEPWALKNQTILSGDRLRNDVVGTDNMFSSLDPTQNTTRTDNLHTVVTFDPSSVDVMLDGITIVGGSADGDGNSGRGGGVSLDGIGCGIQRCLFYFNFASKGGAVYMHKNSGSDSQPCFVYNSVLVSNSAFRRDGFGYGGGIYSEAGVVFDNVVYNNNGGGICVYDETSIVNNTIVNNQLYGIGRPADTDVAGSSISVSNSVIWSINPLNHAGLKGFDALVDRVSNCAIVDWDETKGNDNISLLPYNDHTGSVPNFINPTTQIGAILEPVYADLGVSFLLRQNSVLLSKAEGSWMTTLNTYYGTDVSYDIAGKPRIVSKTLDIGAYQYQPVSGRNILYVRQLSPDEPPLADGEVRDGSTWRLAVQDVQMAIDQLYARNVVGEVWVAGGTYYPTAAFTDESGIRGRTERHRSFIMRSGISVYGGFRGQTGDEGINNSTTRPRDPDHLDVQWAFANRTIFSGDVDRNDDSQKGWRWNAGEKKWEQYYGRNSYHVVWFASEGFNERTTKYEAVTAKPLPVETTLDGVVVTGGCADYGERGESTRMGGGIYLTENGVVSNCIVYQNFALTRGGGVMMNNGGMLVNSMVFRNASPGVQVRNGLGGGVYILGNGTVFRTVITNNTASTGSAYYAESGSTSQLINNTIVRNAHAENVSGDVTSGSTVYSASTAGNNLTNTVIWGNDDAERINADHWEIITSAADVDEDAGNFEVFLDRANEAVMGPRFGFPSDYAGAGNYFASADFSLPSLSTLVNRGTNGGTRRLNTVIEMNPDGSVKSTTITTEPVVLDGSGKGYYAVQEVSGRENVPDTLNSKWRITKEPDTYHIIKKDGVDMIDVKEWKEGTIDIGAYEYETVSLTPFGGNILYVKSSEAVSDKENNGETWERATSNIHQAIQVLLLSPNKKDKYIKIASGDYVPFLQDGTSGYSFVLEKPDVGNLEYSTKSLTLRGGYPNNITGTDVAMDNLRDPILYPTYIRGNRSDSKHLVYIDESMDTAGENGALAPVNIEGFTFVGGNAADATGEGSTGAAVYAANGSTTIRNSVFVDNTAAGEKGAAVYLNKGNIYNTVLHSNKAWGLALNGTGNIVSNTIANNSKGGLYARGALVAEPLQIYNNIFWRNYTSAVPTVGDLNNQIDVQNATLYSNAVQVDDATAEQPNAEYVYWNSSAGVVLGDKAANINKTLSSDNEDMSYGPRFEAPDEATPLDKKYNIRPGRKLINTGYRYMTGDSYNKAENDKWYTDLFAYYSFGSVEEPVAPGDSLARVMFVDAGGNRRIAGNSIDIGAYEYQRLFYPNLYVKPNGFGLGSSWDDAMGDLQEAIYSAYYSGDPEESGTYGTVWVAGGDYVLPTTLQWMANVKVYGGFRGTNETKLTQRPGLLEKNAPESILSVEAEGVPVVRSDNDRAAGTIVENWAELNGFHITGSKNSPAVIVADSFAIVNSVIYNNVNPDGAVVETDGLLYNVLVHDNTVKEGSAAVALDEHAAAIHVTAPGEGAQIGGTGKIINTINGEVTSVSGNAYSPLYVGDYITDDTHLRYQLSDQKDAVLFGIGALQETGVDHEGNPVTTIGGYTVPKIRNGKEYTDIIDLSTDCDVLGNVRLFTDKFHGEGEVIRPDYGCFETWNTTPQKVVNVSDNYYPHAGSVVYVGKESEVRLTDALTKDFAPSYLLLHHAAGLRTGEHAVSLYNLAIERDLKPLINDTTASWDMVSLPFSLEVGNGTMLNGVTIDGLPVEAIQAGDESGDDKNRLYLYEYDGAKRAEDLYSVVAPQNSKYWAFENNQMGANVGYLMATPSASDAVTVRFSKSSSALPVYEESAEEGKSILLKQHNLKTLVGGRPHFTYKENMGWNLFGVPYLCSYTTERMSIDHILYTYDPEASRFVSINSWEGNTIAPFSAVFTQTATVKESEELLFAKPVIPLNTLPAPHGVQLKISGSNLSAGCDYVSVVADNVYGEPMNFDMGNDALKMMSFDPRIPQIYVYNEKGVRFAHTQTADIEGETPVGIYTGESGIYEISLTEDSEYDRYDAVVLTDRSTGRKVDLKHAPYSFTVDDRAMETGRFSLSFKTFSDEMQQPTFYSPGKRQLRIVNLQGGESIGIYDTLGRQRASRKAYGESEEFELESGVYMIRIEGSSLIKGKVVVK